MTVKDGMVVTGSKKGVTAIKSCLWMLTNSITQLAPLPASTCDIDSVKACGPPTCFKTVEPPHKKKAQPPARSIWNDVVVGWKNQKGEVAPLSRTFVLQKKATSVETVTYTNLRDALRYAKVPGVESAITKDALIGIMCQYSCMYSKGMIVPCPTNEEVLSKVREVAADVATKTPTIIIESDSDEDAPLAAKCKARQAEQDAQQQKTVERQQKNCDQYALNVQKKTEKRKEFQMQCQQKAAKKPAAASQFCTCGGEELRSLKCSYCEQFIL
jgi:hypothetical protein